MKTKILFILCLIHFGLICSQSQSKEDEKKMNAKKCYERKYQIITYDFVKGTFDNSMVKPCYKVPTILRITNINPLFYNIKIEADDKVIDYLNTELTEEAKEKITKSEFIKLPEEKKYSLNTDLNSLLPDYTITDETQKSRYNDIKSEYDLQNAKLLTAQKNYSLETDKFKLEQLDREIGIIKLSIQEEENKLGILEKEDTSHKVLINGIKLRFLNLNKNYIVLSNDVKEIIKLNGNFNNYIDKVVHPNMNFQEYQKLVNEAEKNKIKNNIEGIYLLNEKSLKYAYGRLNYYKINSSDYLQKLNDFIIYINESESQIQKISNGNYILKQLNKEIDKMKSQLKSFDDLVTEIDLSKKFNHVEIINRLMQNEEVFEYTSVPIQGVEDYVEFNVDIESRKNISADYYPDNKKSFRYFEYLKGGVRLDFSAGVVLNFGSIDKNYSIQNDVIRKNSKNEFIPDLGIFVHSNFRNSSSWAPGISLDISKFNINSFYLGGSILIGKRNKVIITAGPAFRLTQELKNNFSEYDQVQGIEDVNDILTKNFKIGAFLALTYNLTNKQKGLIKIPQQ